LTLCSLFVLLGHGQSGQQNPPRNYCFAGGEASIRDQISHDLDCSESALRLMAMRAELATLVGQWKAAGGGERLPTVEERLKQNRRGIVGRR
jgi:hypothetical protein